MSRKNFIKYCLRIIDLADIIGLIVVNAIAIKNYDQRGKYTVSSFFLVTEGSTFQDCDPSEAYEFSANIYAQDAQNVINGFNAFPIVLAVIGLVADFGISVYKLAAPISDAQDKLLTFIEIVLTFLFAPIAFPVSDFDYNTCLGTGLSDSIMESLGTYATLGLTMLLWIIIIIGALLIIHFVCKKNQQTKKDLTKIGACVLIIIMLVYAALALLFIILAFLGTINSLATGVLTGFSGVIEGVELYMAIREVQDVQNKVGLGG